MYNWKKMLRECILDEVNLKQLKMKHSEYSDDIDKFVNKIPNKYLEFAVVQLERESEDEYKYHDNAFVNSIISFINQYDELLKRGIIGKTIGDEKTKDINYWNNKNIEDFRQFVVAASHKMSSTEEKRAAKEDIDKIYEDKDFLIISPKSRNACIIYGKNTKWCISSEDRQHYDAYNGTNFFIFIINKTKTIAEKYQKIAISVPYDETETTLAFDALDNEESFSRIQNKLITFFQEDYQKIISLIEDYIDKKREEKDSEE